MSEAYLVHLRSVDGGPTSLLAAGSFTLVADRPKAGGGRGLGFNGGQLLYAAVAACISNDLYREAAAQGIGISRVELTVDGDFPARGAASTPISVDLELHGDAPEAVLRELIELVDRIAEIPNSMRSTTPVHIRETHVVGSDSPSPAGGTS